MDTIQLLGCGYAHPATHVSNHELEKTIDTSDEWIVERTGIRVRHFADENMSSSVMAPAVLLHPVPPSSNPRFMSASYEESSHESVLR